MQSLTIKPFDQNYESEVIDLWKRCGLVVSHNDPSKDIFRKNQVNSEWFFVGEFEGAIIATCMVGYDGHRGCVNYLAVDPSHQGKGYGRDLMKKAEEVLLKVNCPKINLLVRNTNINVISFYKELGYSDNECISMGKRLIPD